MISLSLTIALHTKIGGLHALGFIGVILLKITAYILVAGVFTFLFLVLPNTKVNFKSAFVAAVFSTIFFQILQWAYIKFQIGANSLNAIYGGFAALPLFLILIQYSWYVVLFGAELAFANQNVEHYELDTEIKTLSIRYKKVIALMIANLVTKRFYDGEKPLNAYEIAGKLDLPTRLARNIINDFVETGIFNEVKYDNLKEVVYQPGVTETKLTVKYLFDRLERKGVNTLPIEDSVELTHINNIMLELDKTLDSDLGHLMIKDLVKVI
jgi:membrane protein